MKALPIWYVTFEVHKRLMLPRRRSACRRETRMFETEAEAKDFARAKLNEGLAVFAGTINPYRPRQLILARNIPEWVADGRKE